MCTDVYVSVCTQKGGKFHPLIDQRRTNKLIHITVDAVIEFMVKVLLRSAQYHLDEQNKNYVHHKTV